MPCRPFSTTRFLAFLTTLSPRPLLSHSSPAASLADSSQSTQLSFPPSHLTLDQPTHRDWCSSKTCFHSHHCLHSLGTVLSTHVASATTSKAKDPKLPSPGWWIEIWDWLCHLHTARPRVGCFTSLSLGFLTYKRGKMTFSSLNGPL